MHPVLLSGQWLSSLQAVGVKLRLHERYVTRAIAIFLITSDEYAVNKLKAFNAGAVALFEKPLKVADLNAALEGTRRKRQRVKTKRLSFGAV